MSAGSSGSSLLHGDRACSPAFGMGSLFAVDKEQCKGHFQFQPFSMPCCTIEKRTGAETRHSEPDWRNNRCRRSSPRQHGSPQRLGSPPYTSCTAQPWCRAYSAGSIEAAAISSAIGTIPSPANQLTIWAYQNRNDRNSLIGESKPRLLQGMLHRHVISVDDYSPFSCWHLFAPEQ